MTLLHANLTFFPCWDSLRLPENTYAMIISYLTNETQASCICHGEDEGGVGGTLVLKSAAKDQRGGERRADFCMQQLRGQYSFPCEYILSRA